MAEEDERSSRRLNGKRSGALPSPLSAPTPSRMHLKTRHAQAIAHINPCLPIPNRSPPFLLFLNLLPHPIQILDDVRSEVVKCGAVVGLAAPMPPAHVTNADAARVYVKFSSADEAGRCRNMMDGRKFDDNSVRAIFVTEAEFLRAQAGEWVGKPGLLLDPAAAAAPALAGLAAPGLAGLAGLGAAAAAAPAAAAPAAGGLALPPGFTLPPGFSIAGALPGLGLPK
ncbi:hypothetical protein HYH02_008503 [Chlamydomonas schloesseri]|uniref:RRM domain-containing protein n=1 Tax=Chlamydomonas schloesseri TaxID=2026947 RepID=A0A836B3G7_9CHLO|nr:hypothetical protein HYH02_008503 [Chlamydomonas schloesseri]|eukprot:KAG2446512.1 hypothetical protein HYH02_008503 [Chlamydomonas schloesseri]